jgi:hypothetical protein
MYLKIVSGKHDISKTNVFNKRKKAIICVDTPVKSVSKTTLDKQQQFWLPLIVNDTMDFVKAGFETICEDDVNQVMISAQVCRFF